MRKLCIEQFACNFASLNGCSILSNIQQCSASIYIIFIFYVNAGVFVCVANLAIWLNIVVVVVVVVLIDHFIVVFVLLAYLFILSLLRAFRFIVCAVI